MEDDYPHTGPPLTRELNTDLIAEHYDGLLRLAGSLKFGHATASLLVGKLSASGRTRWPRRSRSTVRPGLRESAWARSGTMPV